MSNLRLTVSHRRLVLASLTAWLTLGTNPAHAATTSQPKSMDVTVSTTEELIAALAPGNAGRRILVRAGTYEVSEPLEVPDGTSLFGEGVMLFDASGLPSGFEPSSRSVIRSTRGLNGDVITLGDGATMQGLTIEDAAGRLLGNVVAVSSRAPHDRVSASINECEIINPNPAGGLAQGPRGRGLLLISRNPNLGSDPPPHEGAELSVHMRQSIVRSPGGASGVFAVNFASSSRISLVLAGNVVGGGLDLAAGASRPDAVTESGISLESAGNLYRSDSPLPSTNGWLLTGGTDAPFPGIVAEATSGNRLRIGSIDDRLEGFARGIFAAAGRRASPLARPVSRNSIDLQLVGLTLRTTSADLLLYGARSAASGMSVGDANILRLVMRGTNGSGRRGNEYWDSWNPLLDQPGTGNQLEVVGSPVAFDRTNLQVIPAPQNQFFSSSP